MLAYLGPQPGWPLLPPEPPHQLQRAKVFQGCRGQGLHLDTPHGPGCSISHGTLNPWGLYSHRGWSQIDGSH